MLLTEITRSRDQFLSYETKTTTVRDKDRNLDHKKLVSRTTAQLFCLDYSGKYFGQKIVRSKNFKQKSHHQVAEALRVEAKAIKKYPLPLLW